MSYLSRIRNVFRREKAGGEIDEELRSHMEEAMEEGRDPEEARRAFGSLLRHREESRDIKLAAWLESLAADVGFGWRQLWQNKTVSLAAIVSLGLAMGACTAAFRLIDAMLLRPLPVAELEGLRFLAYPYFDNGGNRQMGDSFEYPLFGELRKAVKGQAELMAISYSSRVGVTYGSDEERERVFRQYVSGWTFATLGLKPAAGRLLTAEDDRKPGAHPYAVLSYDYWTRRFGRDPKAIGRTFRMGQAYEIVGVLEEGFTGTETGTLTDIYVPTMMNARAIGNPNWGWFRTWVRLRRGASEEQVRQKLQAAQVAFRQARAQEWSSEARKERLDEYVNAALSLEPGAAGVSGMQRKYRRPLAILGVVVVLVLLIACANVANLKTAQAAARGREMALRVSIGAGRWRLVQLVLVESVLIALLASLLGGALAWWSAPFVVSRINPPDDPARLMLPADWRVLGFAAVLTMVVAILFGLGPALRASAVRPMSVLRGGENPHSRRRLMNGLIAAQVAFCFVVHFVAGLFVATFDRLSHQPLGFSPERVLTLEATAKTVQPFERWDEVLQRLRQVNGVEGAAICGWPLMFGNEWTSEVWVDGRPPSGRAPYFLAVSPGWLEAMRIPLLDGRDFRPEESSPQVAIVNESFAKRYFEGRNPVGRSLERIVEKKRETAIIVGYVRDARYRDMREAIQPTVYLPFRTSHRLDQAAESDWATVVVRTAGDPMKMAPVLSREMVRARPEFRVSNIRTQQELIEQHTVRERLLAVLSLFFATAALVLAGVGLYGVLNYIVVQRRREIGIRIALGAKAGDVAWRITAEVFVMLGAGALVGLAAGIGSQRYVESVLYHVKATDMGMLVLPALSIFAAALAAAVPPVIHAVRIDPASMLRTD
ncbi:MAG: ABC transporter permease [Bryobacterales bacterium]|nr:ABC transporter permease [Bryobacterales bacterium]